MLKSIKRLLKKAASHAGIEIRRIESPPGDIRDANLYRPLFSPWFSRDFQKYFAIAAPRTLVSEDRCYVLYTLLQQALKLDGDIIECGVYRGGTAAMIAKIIAESGTAKKLFLHDTFTGMPDTDKDHDLHQAGDFADTSAEQVEKFVNAPQIAVIKKGFIPETFTGMEAHRFAFAHIDVDIYRSIIDSLDFIWPRLSNGGFVVFDDYGFPTCPGAREAVDDFFAALPIAPLCLPTGQAIVFKH